MTENSEIDAEKEAADAQRCERAELLDEFMENWKEFTESCDLIAAAIGESRAGHSTYIAEIQRARTLMAKLDDDQHSAQGLDSVMSDLDLTGRHLNDFNSSFEPPEPDDPGVAEGDTDESDEAKEEDDIKVFCQARIEWKKCRVWRTRFTECLDELKAAEDLP